MNIERLARKPALTPPRLAGLFVTGTDTSVGKTLVATAIVRALVRRGIRVGVYKPVETGCRPGTGGASVVGEDGRLLAAAAASPVFKAPTAAPPVSLEAVVSAPAPLVIAGSRKHRPGSCRVSSYLLRQAAAPMVAAEAEGVRIDPDRLLADFDSVAADSDFVVVEGAGGLLVPIAEDFTYRELASELGLPLLCVVASRLGCINHALLTFDAADAAELPLVGYVINQIGQDEAAAREARSNRAAIARFAVRQSLRDLGLFPFVPAAERGDFDALASMAEAHLDLDAIVEYATGF